MIQLWWRLIKLKQVKFLSFKINDNNQNDSKFNYNYI